MKNVELLTSNDLRVATAATRAGENPLRFGRKFDGPSRIRNGRNDAKISLGNETKMHTVRFHLESVSVSRERTPIRLIPTYVNKRSFTSWPTGRDFQRKTGRN